MTKDGDFLEIWKQEIRLGSVSECISAAFVWAAVNSHSSLAGRLESEFSEKVIWPYAGYELVLSICSVCIKFRLFSFGELCWEGNSAVQKLITETWEYLPLSSPPLSLIFLYLAI